MIPVKNTVTVESFGMSTSRQMSLDSSSVAHIMTVLGNLYSNPILAITREYMTNALDSHIAVGKGDVPISVTLPTEFHPNFIVRDFGLGLTEQEVYTLYGSYGASTKRQSNDFNGQLGFGCKSAFSYTDQFTVEAVKDGMRKIFLFSLDENGVGVINKMGEEITDSPNGVAVSIPIRQEDFTRLRNTVVQFAKYWKVKPDGIEHINPTYLHTATDGFITVNSYKQDYSEEPKIVMGNVAYPIPYEGRYAILKGSSENCYLAEVVIEVPNGYLEFTPSREEMKITPKLVEVLRTANELILSEIKSDLNSKIAGAKNFIEAKEIVESSFPYPRVVLGELEYKGRKISDNRTKGSCISLTLRGGKLHRDYYNTYFNASDVLLHVPHATFDSGGLTGLKESEIRNIKFFMGANKVGRVILCTKTSGRDLIGIGLREINLEDTKGFAPKRKAEKKSGLLGYRNSSLYTRKCQTFDIENELPEYGSEIVVLELKSKEIKDPSLGSMPEGVLRRAIEALGVTVYAAKSSSLPRISKLWKVVHLVDYLQKVAEEEMNNNKDSLKLLSYNFPGKFIYFFQGDASGVEDEILSEAITYFNPKSLSRDLLPANLENLYLALSHIKGYAYTKGIIEESLQVKVDDDFCNKVHSKYPLLIHLTSTSAKLEHVKEYINMVHQKEKK